jgi:cell division transport system ATP-binding protein
VQVAHDERGPALRRPAALAEGDDAVAVKALDVLCRPEHRTSEWMLTEHRAVDQVLGHDGGLVVGAGDLLHDDAAFAVQLIGVDPGPGDEVGEQVGGLIGAFGTGGDVKCNEVVAGVGVEHGADLLGALVDIPVVGELLSTLEHEVLQEMGHPVLGLTLGPRAGVEGGEERHRSSSLDGDAMQAQTVAQVADSDLGHFSLDTVAAKHHASCKKGGRRGGRPLRCGDPMAPVSRPTRRTAPASAQGPTRHAAPSPTRSSAARSVIDFRSVSKLYAGDVGLDRATFTIDRGEFVFIVGSTGSGKSTVMRLLIKELEPTDGTIRVAGHDLSEIGRRRVPFFRRNIGVVFQDFKLLPSRTVYDNVAYALQVTGGTRRDIRDKVPDILRLTGLSTKLHNLPHQLSGGEQQRVSIARAFVNHPPLLLADEPTGNLDPDTSIDIMRLLYRINRTGTTVLVATHDQTMVDRMRRRVLELRDGRLVRDEAAGRYTRDETTRDLAKRLRAPGTTPPGVR